MKTQPVLELDLGHSLGQLRAAPVSLGAGEPRAFVIAYSADAEIDPSTEMFFFPSDALKLAVVTAAGGGRGEILWRRELPRSVVPGLWFCPVMPFDLDGDGLDEIWFVSNADPDHPLGTRHRRLERIDPLTGNTTGGWDWPNRLGSASLSSTFRYFIAGGYARGAPVLVTAQGTYGDMYLSGWRGDMTRRWERVIRRDDPGARGSHMCPIADLDTDPGAEGAGKGVQQIMWGERCIELDTGKELFCADRGSYRGHSDVVAPFLDPASGRRLFFTCRESDHGVSPRVATFDSEGKRVWGAVEKGHMDMGWVARLGEGGGHVAMAVRIGGKGAGPSGFARRGVEEFVFGAATGERLDLGFSVYGTVPVDLDGDGRHELVRAGMPNAADMERQGEVLSAEDLAHGEVLAEIGGDAHVAMASKFLDMPGEQILAWYPDGRVAVWADLDAKDTDEAKARYADPLYAPNARLAAVGYNIPALGGV